MAEPEARAEISAESELRIAEEREGGEGGEGTERSWWVGIDPRRAVGLDVHCRQIIYHVTPDQSDTSAQPRVDDPDADSESRKPVGIDGSLSSPFSLRTEGLFCRPSTF